MREQTENSAELNPVDLVLALLVASFVITLVLIDRFVVPAFAAVYRDFSGVLPAVTRAVLAHVAPYGFAALAVGLAFTGLLARRRGAGALAMGLLLAGTAVGMGGVAFCFYALYLPRAPL